MKVKSFKVRAIDGEVVKNLTDKQAGELYKAICAYNFNNEEYKGRDELVRTVFALMKDEFDRDRFFRETGKIGGIKSAAMKRESECPEGKMIRAIISTEMVSGMLQGIINDLENPENPCKGGGSESATNSEKR
ncbi:MAG: DUF6291 domain-containing protein [Candidatus Coproplasma sp.]